MATLKRIKTRMKDKKWKILIWEGDGGGKKTEWLEGLKWFEEKKMILN